MKKLLVILSACFMVVSMVQADPDELAELQQILQATRAGWEAGETSVSQLSSIEQEQLLGLLPGIGDMASLPDENIERGPAVTGKYVVPHTPVRNQGSCGSCYAFGACASYESQQKVKGNSCDLSEQWFMMRAKAIGPHGGCRGWYLDTSMNLLKNDGVADEASCPYKASEQNCPSGAKSKYRISSWSRTTAKDTLKRQIHSGAVYVGFAVYSDFSYYKTGYYEYKSGYRRGYHAVAAVGYDDVGFYVKNSWGTGWGDRGYFWIKYNQMTNVIQFGTCFGGSYYITQ